VYLAGGPGGYALSNFDSFRDFSSWYQHRDFIVVEQRGVGLSQPALNCPEIASFEIENMASMQDDSAYLGAVRDCRERLVDEGIDLSLYNTDESAADVEALRVALGYDQWNLFGTSYGTSLVQTVVRDYPGGVRSVILDSPLSLDSNWALRQVVLAESAFENLFARCCGTDAEPLFALAEQESVQVTVDFYGTSYDVALDGDEVLQVVYRALYFPQAIGELPQAILAALEGDYRDLGVYELYAVWEPGGYSLGMNYSVLCADTANQEAIAGTGVIGDAFGADWLKSICEIWNVPPRPNDEELVQTDILALLLVGEFDPVAPYETAMMVAEPFNTVYVVAFPGLSHLVSFSSPCPRQIAVEFLDDPSSVPATTCIEQLPEISFD
jgi:pimeloyl-ACP methyl ester carboxylesterase